MKIAIKQRLKPFAITPGTWCLLPYSVYGACIFPSKIDVYDLRFEELNLYCTYPLESAYPQKPLMITQDWERGVITVDSKDRVHLLANGDLLKKKKPPLENKVAMRLSLGSCKKLFWEKISLQFDPFSIIPLMLLACQPKRGFSGHGGVFTLLENLQAHVEQKRTSQIIFELDKIFRAAFKGLFVPRLIDDQYQGITSGQGSGSPLAILDALGPLLLSLFIKEENQTVHLLPCLPPQLHAGKCLQYEGKYVDLDFEWSKKEIKKVRVRPKINTRLAFCFPKVRQCRITFLDTKQSRIYYNGSDLILDTNKTYWFDRFMK